MRSKTKSILKMIVVTMFLQAGVVQAQDATGQANQNAYQKEEVISTGQRLFGRASTGLAAVIENAISKYGEPNGYIIGKESSVALIAGLQYGEGELHTREFGIHKVYWQGPTVGVDVGVNGNQVMMLVYNLPSYQRILNRFVGLNGSAFVAGGFGMTVLSNEEVYVVPVRVGLGIRLGINAGYLKFTEFASWNPF